MRDILKMVVVLSAICGIAGFALSYLKMVTAVPIEEQVLTYVQGPVLQRVFANADNDPVAERERFPLADGTSAIVFPVKKDGKLVGVAIEHMGKGFGGDIGMMAGFNIANDTLVGVGVTTMKETPGIGTVVGEHRFTKQFIGKNADVTMKSGGGEIDAISGATISSVGATLAVNNAAKVYAEIKEKILTTWP